MMIGSSTATIGDDQPLRVGQALAGDKLHRKGFAATALDALRVVSPARGVVLSVEGAWGSGKTSSLAIIEELLQQQEPRPVIIRFNPWLIGDRDSLLRQFLAALSNGVGSIERSAEGKKIAKELKAYAKAFDVVKLIPGAEPWASLVKAVVEAVGDTTHAISDYKAPDLERQKDRVAEALRRFDRRVAVFIDDIDRLFPVEVFEMVRIIKSVGDLPNVGYVVAWDPKYVTEALTAASIPHADIYLDKVVQARLPIPAMSLTARSALIDDAFHRLDADALKSSFRDDEHRFPMLYWSGLRELLEQPRDVTRVFNTVSLIEPRIRGELALAEIVGLAALMVRAPAVFDLLKREPRWFVGNLPGASAFRSDQEVVQEGREALDAAIAACDAAHAVRQLVNRMFPLTGEGALSSDRGKNVEGRIASPSRLLVALQLSVSDSDVSFVDTRRFLREPASRPTILANLTVQNCQEFLEALGDVATALEGKGIADIDALCLDIARMPDAQPFATRAKDRSKFYLIPAEDVALRTIELVVRASDESRAAKVAASICRDPACITSAVEIFIRSYLRSRSSTDYLLLSTPRQKATLARAISRNVLLGAQAGNFMRTAHPSYVLFALPEIYRPTCRQVFKALATHDPSLDAFASAIMMRSFDSHKGQIYELPEKLDRVEAYARLGDLRRHGRQRLGDPHLTYPARAAWQAMVNGQALYAVDGSPSTM